MHRFQVTILDKRHYVNEHVDTPTKLFEVTYSTQNLQCRKKTVVVEASIARKQ